VLEWVLLAVALLLVAANALFVAAEFSLVTVDRATVERAAGSGDRRAEGVLAALRSLSTQLSGAQLGITVTSLIVGFLVEPSLAALLRAPLLAAGLADGAVTGVAVALALVVATCVQMVFGELVPKNLAIAEPLPVARAVAGFQRGFSTATRPLLSFLNGTANRIVRLLGIEPQEELRSARSPQELGSLVRRSADQGTLPQPTAELLDRSLSFGELTAADVMTPRFRVTFLAAEDSLDRVLDVVESSGRSRFPVLRGGVDSVVGIVHVKHALAVPEAERAASTVDEVMVAPLVVPGSQELDPLMRLLREQGLQMAVVVDEYGGTDGVVTLEDLVEELVGDISDEHDERARRACRGDDGSWSLSGLLRPDEIAEITGFALPEEDDVDTLGGLVVDRLGRIPEVDDEFVEDLGEVRVRLRVESMDGWRVARVRLAPADVAQPGAPEGGAR
jgi:CBS domain containing-hemolysin-like protein